MPSGRRSGGEVVSQAFVDGLLALGHDVTVAGWLPPGEHQPTATRERIASAGVRHIETADAPRAARAAWFVRALASGLPYSAAKYRGRSYPARGSADLVIVDHAQVGWAAPVEHPYVYIAHNVEHELYGEAAARSESGIGRRLFERETRLMRELEGTLVRAATAVWALTDSDAHALRGLGASRAAAFPVPGLGAPRAPADRSGVGVIGNWTWGPNEAGLRWFADEVVPLLPADIGVRVAGGGADWLAEHPRIEYAGRVPDAGEFLAAARVIAVPATAGAGIQVKTLDAIASGAWVVATPTGMRGIGDPPPSVTVAGDAPAFAAAIARAAAGDPPAGVGAEWSRARQAAFHAQLRSELALVASLQ